MSQIVSVDEILAELKLMLDAERPDDGSMEETSEYSDGYEDALRAVITIVQKKRLEMMTPENRILTLAAEGRIIRHAWADTDEHGRQLLCLYTALAGDPEARPATCPAHLAPQWVAHLMPWWDDAASAERWFEVVQQVGELAPHLGELTGAKGRRALARCQLFTLRAVVPVAGSSLPVVERVVALWERELAGDEPTNGEWSAARAEAVVAAKLASAAAWAEAAWAVAARVAESASVARAESAWAASWAAEAVLSDTIIFGHLAAIREELGL
ncbi:MAG: hypothetical protein IPP12_22365 [Nitrospira sp.]|nr:hypothetical protein [Nitrospira sp.]